MTMNVTPKALHAGMPPPMGAPPMGPPPPDAKRQRREGLVLEPEEEFLQKYPGPSKVYIMLQLCLVNQSKLVSVRCRLF